MTTIDGATALSTDDSQAMAGRNYRLLSEIPMRLSVEVGSTSLKLSELLELAEGSIVELVGSSRVDLQACKLEYSIVSPK